MNISLEIYDVAIRLFSAILCGGLIGIERGKKHRPAGFRTHMIVCLGAALTMLLGMYLALMISEKWQNISTASSIDVSRFGAQVINGIGFLGAGTIILTSNNRIKGTTTAAGLWASACMGLAIGAGFYQAAIVGCILIIFTISFLSKLEIFIMSRTRNITLYIEVEHLDGITNIIEKTKALNAKIFDVEITKKASMDNNRSGAVFTLKLAKKITHAKFIAEIADVDSVISIEEL